MEGYKVKKEKLKNGKVVYRVRQYNDSFSFEDLNEKNVFWKGTSKKEAYNQRAIIEKQQR